jgi:hypothetical protein
VESNLHVHLPDSKVFAAVFALPLAITGLAVGDGSTALTGLLVITLCLISLLLIAVSIDRG